MKQLIILFLLFFISCDQEGSEQKKLIQNILMENQKIHDFLMENGNKTPDLKGLKTSLNNFKEKFPKNNQIVDMIAQIEGLNNKSFDEFIEKYDIFSIQLANLAISNNAFKGYSKFFCPMLKKVWISKGEDVHNPYDSEMRHCGLKLKNSENN